MKKYYLAHKKYLLGLFKDPAAIRLVSRINPWSVEEILIFFYCFFFNFFTLKRFFESYAWFLLGYSISHYS